MHGNTDSYELVLVWKSWGSLLLSIIELFFYDSNLFKTMKALIAIKEPCQQLETDSYFKLSTNIYNLLTFFKFAVNKA